MWPDINLSALIGILTGHVIFKLRYNRTNQLKTTYILLQILHLQVLNLVCEYKETRTGLAGENA